MRQVLQVQEPNNMPSLNTFPGYQWDINATINWKIFHISVNQLPINAWTQTSSLLGASLWLEPSMATPPKIVSKRDVMLFFFQQLQTGRLLF